MVSGEAAMTIPKNILSCWFGRGEKSDLLKRCIESWHKYMPDWHFHEVTEDNLDPGIMQSPFMKGTLERKEYAKAADYARLQALQDFGGIYLDVDMEVLKPLDPLLQNSFFAGWEDDKFINTAIMGSEQRSLVSQFLVREFPLHTPGLEKTTYYSPLYLTAALQNKPAIDFPFRVYQPEYFYPSHWSNPAEIKITPNTFTFHHWAGSWVQK